MRHDETELSPAQRQAVHLAEEALRGISALCAQAESEQDDDLIFAWLGVIGIGLWCRMGAEPAIGVFRATAEYIREDVQSESASRH